MRAEDIRQLLDAKPFRPFRIYLTDGKTFDIQHPEFVVVFKTKLEICYPVNSSVLIFEHAEHCALLHIVRIEELHPKAA